MEPLALSRIGAWIAVVGFAGLAVFQVLLALGAPLGRVAWGGRHRRLPRSRRIASLISAGILVFGCFCVLETTRILVVLDWPRVTRGTVWALVGLFVLSTLGNAMSDSTLERRIMTPIALILSLACLLVVFGT